MSTTIQVAENLRVGTHVNIDGQRCEVERASFSSTISQKMTLEELVNIMSSELLERQVIGRDKAGSYYWIDDGEPLVPEAAYQN